MGQGEGCAKTLIEAPGNIFIRIEAGTVKAAGKRRRSKEKFYMP